jgi:hypothetical protein
MQRRSNAEGGETVAQSRARNEPSHSSTSPPADLARKCFRFGGRPSRSPSERCLPPFTRETAAIREPPIFGHPACKLADRSPHFNQISRSCIQIARTPHPGKLLPRPSGRPEPWLPRGASLVALTVRRSQTAATQPTFDTDTTAAAIQGRSSGLAWYRRSHAAVFGRKSCAAPRATKPCCRWCARHGISGPAATRRPQCRRRLRCVAVCPRAQARTPATRDLSAVAGKSHSFPARGAGDRDRRGSRRQDLAITMADDYDEIAGLLPTLDASGQSDGDEPSA